MKILSSKVSTVTIALLMLLALYFFANSTFSVFAAPIKDPNVYINGSGYIQFTWKSGRIETYSSDVYVKLGGLDFITFIPSWGWHISTIFIDGLQQDVLDEDGFTLFDVQAKNTVAVSFMENGGVDDVDSGAYVEAYPDPAVGLIFENVILNGFVYAYQIGIQPPDAKSESWDVQTDAVFDQNVTVILVLSLADLGGIDPYTLKLLRTDTLLARSDVNQDGWVDGDDVSIVANANPSWPGDPLWDPDLDINMDGFITDEDVNIVNNYIGELVWIDITTQVIVENGFVYIYGKTDHFSIFGVS